MQKVNDVAKLELLDIAGTLTLVFSIICLAVPAIWGTWVYWTEMLSHLPENASFFLTTMLLIVYSLIYVIILGVLGWVWSYASVAIAVISSTVITGFIWLYRKICP
ncbi:MAG: hypothetical protein PUJ68_00090 [[Actinobacillus] rossii]|nr:hypothetical protein [[Actinobacillus] rossii]MDY3123694.1 hypothetical protein [[Actinobacillus] rossii]MDY5792855.1 hypothetical protein [[Actinobacillus] rossii]